MLMFGLAACASSTAETPAQRVFAAKSEYAAVLAAVSPYEALPRCAVPRVDPCSDAAVVSALRKVEVEAFAALNYAEALVRNQLFADGDKVAKAVVAAQVALSAFREVALRHGILK